MTKQDITFSGVEKAISLGHIDVEAEACLRQADFGPVKSIYEKVSLIGPAQECGAGGETGADSSEQDKVTPFQFIFFERGLHG